MSALFLTRVDDQSYSLRSRLPGGVPPTHPAPPGLGELLAAVGPKKIKIRENEPKHEIITHARVICRQVGVLLPTPAPLGWGSC